jgi:hypothetical protein
MQLAGDYAYAGRDIVVGSCSSILGAKAVKDAQPSQLRVAGGALRADVLG